MQEVQARLRRIERRDWWLWTAAIVIILLLTLAILSLALPGLWKEQHSFFGSLLQRAVLALSGLVLLFVFYVVYQEVLIKRLRVDLAEQVAEGSRLQAATEELQRLAMLDQLTGLYTEPFLRQQLVTEMARSRRQDYQLNVLMLDLNNFRQINDAYGQSAGDLILKEFAQRLRKSIRSSDLAGRVGCDEFLALLPESSPEWVPHLLARLSGLEVDSAEQKISVTFAAGWTACGLDEQPDQILDRARQQMVDDKHTGLSEEAIRRARAEVRHMQNVEALARLAGKMAHDFSNLITLVKSYSEMALDCLGQGDPVREYIEQIHKANERANSLTRQLLAFTRTPTWGSEMLDLNVVMAEMERIVQRLIGDHIDLLIKPGHDLGRVKLNRGQVEQVILNLAINARDDMPTGGKLILETANVELDQTYARLHPGARLGSYVMLVVRDTGSGMTVEALAQVFEPFFIKKEKGKGLDLAAVYGIVKQSGGYIWADSEPGQGTTFTIFLPRSRENSPGSLAGTVAV